MLGLFVRFRVLLHRSYTCQPLQGHEGLLLAMILTVNIRIGAISRAYETFGMAFMRNECFLSHVG